MADPFIIWALWFVVVVVFFVVVLVVIVVVAVVVVVGVILPRVTTEDEFEAFVLIMISAREKKIRGDG